MTYTKEILERVKNAGILQYDIDKVINLVNPEDRAQFSFDITNEETVLCFVYTEGLNSGKYKIDVANYKLAAAEAELKTLEVKREKEVASMIDEYLGESPNKTEV